MINYSWCVIINDQCVHVVFVCDQFYAVKRWFRSAGFRLKLNLTSYLGEKDNVVSIFCHCCNYCEVLNPSVNFVIQSFDSLDLHSPFSSLTRLIWWIKMFLMEKTTAVLHLTSLANPHDPQLIGAALTRSTAPFLILLFVVKVFTRDKSCWGPGNHFMLLIFQMTKADVRMTKAEVIWFHWLSFGAWKQKTESLCSATVSVLREP